MNFFIFCEMDKKAAVLLDGRLMCGVSKLGVPQPTET